jgi:hypothetical protein
VTTPSARQPKLRPLLAWLLFHRFHLGVAAAFVAFPFLAAGSAASLLANLFVLTFAEQLAVATLAVLLGHVLVLTTWTSTRNGPLRLWPGLEPQDADEPRDADTAIRLGYREFRHAFRRAWGTSRKWQRWVGILEPWIALALALPMLVVVGRASAENGSGVLARLAAPALGFALAELLRAAAALVTAWLTPADARHGFVAGAYARRAVRIARRHTPRLAARLRDLLRRRLARPPFGPGYVWVDRDGERFLHSGHLAAAGLCAATTLVYVAIGLLDRPSAGDPELPALGALLLVATIAAWALPGLGFLLDRFRAPVLAALLIVSLALYALAGGDHFFAVVEPAAGVGLPAAADADRAVVDSWFAIDENRPPRPPRPIVAVAAAGGGLTASAWTAAALSGLAAGQDGAEFLASLRLVSGVSGGAVGAMFVLDGFQAAAGLDAARRARILAAASASSLDAVGWGLAYPDLLRLAFAFPFATALPSIDRGWALEESWRRRLADPSAPPTLGSWRRATLAGELPLFVANATAVETGGRFQLATLALAPSPRAHAFWSEYAGRDLAIATAARLSASFPFVSPPARARSGRGGELPAAHFVDGGYAENSGLLTVLEILDRALERRCGDAARCRAPRIVLLRLQPFGTAPRPLASARLRSSWLAAGLAPLETLVAVRTASQAERNELDLALFTGKWRPRGIEIDDVVLALAGDHPLSWKLTDAERRGIFAAWQELEPEARAALRLR